MVGSPSGNQLSNWWGLKEMANTIDDDYKNHWWFACHPDWKYWLSLKIPLNLPNNPYHFCLSQTNQLISFHCQSQRLLLPFLFNASCALNTFWQHLRVAIRHIDCHCAALIVIQAAAVTLESSKYPWSVFQSARLVFLDHTAACVSSITTVPPSARKGTFLVAI